MIVRENRSLSLTKITIGRFWNANDVLENLDILCPKLVNLVLPNVTLDQCLKLKNLSKLPNLVHLHIGQAKFDRLVPALQNFGPKLKTLTFSNFVDTVDLAQICKYCPNLESLGINAGHLILDSDQKMPKKLSEIKFNVHANISSTVWTKIFCEALRLTYIGKVRYQLEITKNHPLGGAPKLLMDY